MAKVKRNIFSRLSFAAAALTLSGLLALSYVSALINPETGWLWSLAGLLYLPLLIATLLFFLWALKRRARVGFLLFLMLLPSLHIAGRYIQLKGGENEDGAIRIVTYNVGLFEKGDISRKENNDSIATFLNSLGADIICLQEVSISNSIATESWLEANFPGYYAEYFLNTGGVKTGNLTLSKFPVSGKGKFSFENSANMALYTDIDFPHGTFRIYNCHFESYNISLSHLLTGIRKEDEWVEDTGRKMKRSIRQRPSQVNAVVKDIEESAYKAIVLGDFNDTPLSYTYHRLSKGRKDSFAAAGKGFGASFRYFWPLLRIDYILLPPGLDAVSHKTLRIRHSDHYPIIVTCNES